MAQKPQKVKMEFSKKLTVLSWAVTLILTVLVIVLPLVYMPIDGILAVLPYSWGGGHSRAGFLFVESQE